jgi:hypothetical protein
MIETEILTEKHWQVAHQVAQQLVLKDADVNEFGKTIAYLRTFRHENNAGRKFFKYLQTLVANGRVIGHSSKTSDYYKIIWDTSNQHLRDYQDEPETLLHILGWVFRLMKYYKSSEIGELIELVDGKKSEEVGVDRQAEIAEIVQSQNFEVGQVLDAKISGIKGNKVTYEILGTIKLTQKEPRNFQSLSEEQMVKVEIVELKEDGSIKKVKLIDF